MAKAEATVEELVSKIERGELRLPEMQRRYVWRSPRVRDLLDSLYRGYPSSAILLWETDEDVPLQDFAVAQQQSAFHNPQLLPSLSPVAVDSTRWTLSCLVHVECIPDCLRADTNCP